MTDERVVDIDCAGERLVGVLHPGAPGARLGVVVVVGGGQYRVGAHRQFVRLARALAEAGVPVLRFDVRGMGDSDGEARHFLALDDDIRAAVDALHAHVETLDGTVLWGLCDGASASVLYAGHDTRVRGLALVNPWISTDEGVARTYLKHYYSARLRDPGFWRGLIRGRVAVGRSLRSLASTVARLRRPPATDTEGADSDEPTLPDAVFDALARYRDPVLVVVSDADLTAREFHDELERRLDDGRLDRDRPLEVESLTADHTFSSSDAHRALCETTLRWLQGRVSR